VIPKAAVEFVASLIQLPAGTPEHTVGNWMWGHMGDGDMDGVMVAVTDVMQNWAPGTRWHELALEIWWLLGGREVAA